MDWKGTTMLVPKPRDGRPGGAVQYAIKYEDLEVTRGVNGFDPADRNWLAGTLRDVIFKGQTANYIVVLTDGSEIIVSSATHGLDLQPSEAVVVHWPVARGACFQV
jgi:hypothetical protein